MKINVVSKNENPIYSKGDIFLVEEYGDECFYMICCADAKWYLISLEDGGYYNSGVDSLEEVITQLNNFNTIKHFVSDNTILSIMSE